MAQADDEFEYIEAVDVPDQVRRVKKQVWNGEKFVPITVYRIKGWLGMEQENWLLKSFGHAGVYRDGKFWDYSRAGNFTVMDEKVYVWYQMKWGNKCP
jgi:hypothetical protein